MNFKDTLNKIFRQREMSVTIIILLVSVLIGIIEPKFFNLSNIRSIAIGMSTDGILAIALTLVLVLGGIDLSVGSIMALSCVITGGLFLQGQNIWFAMTVSIFVSVIIGLFTGLMISKVGLPPFIVTLGVQSLARGASYIFTKGSPLSMGGLPESFKFLGTGRTFGIPTLFIIYIVITIVFDVLLRNSRPFKNIFYVGSNENAARLSGINVGKVKISVYTISAVLASIAGVLSLARFNVATPTLGIMGETRAISAAVIGGTSMTGGVGSIAGATLGVVLLNLINNGLVMLNVSVYWQDFVTGAILVLAVTVDYLSSKNKNK